MKYTLSGGAIAPFRATPGSAAFDLFVPECFEKTAIFPGHPTTIDFKVCVEIPEGWCGFLLPRSGLGTKQGLQLHNTVGLIDSDYRQSLKTTLSLKEKGLDREMGELLFIRPGDRLVQLVLLPCYPHEAELVSTLSDPGTRDGGFGSTGTNKNVLSEDLKDAIRSLPLSKGDGKA